MPLASSIFLSGKLERHTSLRRFIALRTFILCSFALYVLAFDFGSPSLLYIAVLTGASFVFSLISWHFRSSKTHNETTRVFIQLLWDSALILVFVWLVGRSTNPFIYYQLLVIAISASILPEKYSWIFSVLGICAYTLMMYLDLGIHIDHMDASFKSHLIGMWVNFSGSALLISFFISRLSSALRQQKETLMRVREENLENEQLIGIGTLAASTVHSFGTPLSTIAMTTSELKEIHKDQDTVDCLNLIQAQIERCKSTMKKLSSLTARRSLIEQEISIVDLADELEEYLYLVNAKPMPQINVPNELKSQYLKGGILLIHAIINLVDNAVNAAKSTVVISVDAKAANADLRILIEDDGDGIHVDASDTSEKPRENSSDGLGIGLLLVNSTIERLGGSVRYNNPSTEHPLTQIVVQLPRFGQE